MKDLKREQYRPEFKQEAAPLIQDEETVTAAAQSLGITGQTLHNRVKARAAGQLRGVADRAVSAERLEIPRLKAELARMRMARDILKKAAAYFARESR